jgi:NAD(P)-dependent dehydrogenase (short-subunit alcohol dehydrogenase family)
MNKLQGKVAVVTGANSGIGFATAQRFAQEGARVVILGRRQDAVDDAVARIGHEAVGVVGDVGELDTHDRLMKVVAERFGRIDIYMANAGIALLEPTASVSTEHYDSQFATNTRAVFFGVTKALPLMAQGGSILLTSSIASGRVMEGHAVYAGSKAAIEAFARTWAIELKDRRIRVNVVSPGPVNTPIIGKLGVPDDQRDAFEQTVSERIPAGRFGRPEELANAALFLVSDDASYVNGVNLLVDGGMTLL